MPKGAKKRKAAKKKQEEEEEINLKSNNFDSKKEDKESGLDSDERIEITDSSHDHDKSSSSRSSSSSSSSSSSDDESREVKKKDDDKNSVSEVISVSSVPEQPVPMAGDVPFMDATANDIVEGIGLMDSTTPTDPNSGEVVEIAHVDESSLPKPNESKPEVSLATESDVKETDGKTSTLPESSGVTESSNESEVVISHEEEAPVRPTHGVAQRTSWLSCCGLFDVMTGSK